MKKLIILPLVLLCGCAVVRVKNENPNTGPTTITAYVPIWPWNNGSQIASKLTVSAKTNWFLGGVKGLEQTGTTDTNLLNTAGKLIGEAAKAFLVP